MRPRVSRRRRLPCGSAVCLWCKGGHKAPPLHQSHTASPSAFSIARVAICAKPLRAKRRRLGVPLGAFSYISILISLPRRARRGTAVARARCARAPSSPRHCASVPLMGRLYGLRKKWDIMFTFAGVT